MLKTLNDVSEYDIYAFTCLIVDKDDESGTGFSERLKPDFWIMSTLAFVLYINNATQTSCYHLSCDILQICVQEYLDLVIFHLIWISLM